LAILGVLPVVAFGSNDPVKSPQLDASVERGRVLQGGGFYPILSGPPNEGRSAEDVAHERCARTATAF
jgi:hypothetical protein